jgi:hypothetical protein
MTVTLSRRNMLRLGAASAAALALPFATPTAAAARGKKLVMVLASGGWDTTYVFDPKPGSTAIDQSEGTLRALSGIPVLTSASRPAVTAFFERYGALTTLVNGIQVRSFVHTDCMKRILAGTPSETSPDVCAIVASVQGADLPVPYLVLGTSARSGPLSSITARAGTTNQMSSLLASPAVAAADPLLPAAPFALTDAESALVAGYAARSADRLGTRLPAASVAREIDAFKRSLDRRDLLRKFSLARGGFGGRKYTPDLDVQVEVALSALEGGLCHSVMLESGDWDTHQNNASQSAKFESLFSSVAALVGGLEQRNLLGDTVVLVLSEMGRTPKLNAGLGKDHWPVTSGLVIGGGLRGGRVLGATDALLGAKSMDFATGAPSASGKQLQTSNLIAGFLGVAGVDASTYVPGAEPFDALRV